MEFGFALSRFSCIAGAARAAAVAIIVQAAMSGLPAQAEPASPALELLGETIAPSSMRRVKLKFGESYAGDTLGTPVLVVHGARPGPSLCLTAAIHGDELNGIEVVRRIVYGIDPAALNGTVIGVPVVNLLAFTHGARETPDRRDLNRYFPGKADGSFAARTAHRLFSQVIKPHCDYLVDFHTGSFKRANLPQLRANLKDADVRRFASRFGDTPVLQKRGSPRMLRRVASEAGIPSVSFEFGEATTVQMPVVDTAITAVRGALRNLEMLADTRAASGQQLFYEDPVWVRVEHGGIFVSHKALGDAVARDEIIGTVANPLTDQQTDIVAPVGGRILGLASNQFVLPGFGVFNIARPMVIP
jgi:uncharacterized protein